MIATYLIIGYAIEEPYLNKKMRRLVKENPELYESLSKTIKLVLINDKELVLKSIFRLKQGELYHKYSKKTNWYKFTHAIFRLKDYVKIFICDHHCLEDFIGEYISYNSSTKKWVYAADKNRKPFKLTDEMKEFINFKINTQFYITDEFING